MPKIKLYTIGYTGKSAEAFFTLLKGSGASQLIDVRLNNTSQLAAYSKRDDLNYFTRELLGWRYEHLTCLAPEPEMFQRYKKEKGDWTQYRRAYLALLKKREVEKQLDPAQLNGACLLCSEHRPEHCHRTAAAEYLEAHWGPIELIHLL